jgi:hypothetical protein
VRGSDFFCVLTNETGHWRVMKTLRRPKKRIRDAEYVAKTLYVTKFTFPEDGM